MPLHSTEEHNSTSSFLSFRTLWGNIFNCWAALLSWKKKPKHKMNIILKFDDSLVKFKLYTKTCWKISLMNSPRISKLVSRTSSSFLRLWKRWKMVWIKNRKILQRTENQIVLYRTSILQKSKNYRLTDNYSQEGWRENAGWSSGKFLVNLLRSSFLKIKYQVDN